MKRLLSFALLIAAALPALCQDDFPLRSDDPEFMEYFDEAYSVYLDGSNRCAGISELTGPETYDLWTMPEWGPGHYDLSFSDSVMTVEKTIIRTDANWAPIELELTGWKGRSGIPFTHIAQDQGEIVDTLTGMFVDMSVGKSVTMSFEVKTDTDCQLRVDLVDANGRMANGKEKSLYQNSFKQDLYAKDGWVTINASWETPLFDFYSQTYWGESNGMEDGSDSLWAFNQYGDRVSMVVEHEMPVPVSMQAISKISMIIDDGTVAEPGYVGDEKTLQFRNMVLGREQMAVPFKAVTDENIASGTITYTPANAQLVRARQDIIWNESRYCPNCEANTPPYRIQAFPHLNFPIDFGTVTFNLDDYFSDNETGLTYSASVANYGTDDIFVDVSGNMLSISKDMNGNSSWATVLVSATDAHGAELFAEIEISAHGSNGKYFYDTVPDLHLSRGFGVHYISLQRYMQIYTGNHISCQCKGSQNNSLEVVLSDNTILIYEGDQNDSIEVSVCVTNDYVDESECQSFTVTYDKSPDNNRPYIAKPLDDIVLDQGFGTVSFNLEQFFADPDGDKLTYDAWAYTIPEWNGSVGVMVEGDELILSENSLGHSKITIIVSDGEYTFSVAFDAWVLEKGNQKPEMKQEYLIMDVNPDVGKTSIDLSEYFTDQDELIYLYSMGGYDPNASISENILQINSLDIGWEKINVVATDGKGGKEIMPVYLFLNQENAIWPTITSPIPDVTMGIGESKRIQFSDFIQLEDEFGVFIPLSYDNNIINLDTSFATFTYQEFFIEAQGFGSTEVNIMVAYPNGTYAKQSFTVTVGSPTSVLQIEEPELSIFPTVFTETLTVQGAGGSAITVYTMAGMPVFTLPAISSDETLNLNHLAPGMYFLQVNGETMPIVKE